MLNSAESRLWHQVQHPQVLHFRPESYAKAGVAIDRMLDGIGRFIAIHFRSEEFDKRQCHSNQRIINFLVAMRKQYSLSETYPLFVATDSPQWFDKNAFSYSGIKVVFWQDILQTVPFASSKHDAILEQLICGFSALFIGTGGSTFTSQVIKFRERLMERPSVLLPGTEFIDP